jgi:aspartate aminotransferase-like enzyme
VEFVGTDVEHMLVRLHTAVGHMSGAIVEVGHMGCLEIDCMHSVLQTAEAAVHTAAADILASMGVEVMQ